MSQGIRRWVVYTGIFVLGVALYVVMVLIGVTFGLNADIARLLAFWRAARLFHSDRDRRSGTQAISGKDTTMSDEDQMIAEARARDERAAKLLGDYTPIEAMLRTTDTRANLWHGIINYLARVRREGSDDLAATARELLKRVREL